MMGNKRYEHIQTLREREKKKNESLNYSGQEENKSQKESKEN